MNRKEYQEVKEIFHVLLELSPQERTEYLDAHCSNDTALRREVEELLETYNSDFLMNPTLLAVPEHIMGLGFKPGQTIGQYTIRKKIGEGGMGIVYEAEQQNPRRLVALKVIRGGFHANQFQVKLFEREIQALARLKHVGIAAIYESGLAEDGQLFFAMELVHGTPLLDFVRSHGPAADKTGRETNDRLKLFRKICEVVSYAHQCGVIHRDLKPDNILITDDSEAQSRGGSGDSKIGVKILDFGLARITEPDVAGTAELSQNGQIKGTLQYMSPEQVRGNPLEVDMRTDVYSLGVILYEILFGQPPYSVRDCSIIEAIRVICEEQPQRQRNLLRSAGDESRKYSRTLDSDIETIVLKALEKESERRYQSVAAMADDIERYLTNQPILARPPSAAYQLRKLVARHKPLFASLTLVFLMLLGFGIVMAAQSARIVGERDKAVVAEQTAQEQKIDAEQARENEQKQRLIAEENLHRAENEQKRAETQKKLAETAQRAEEKQRKIAEENLARAENEQKRAEEQKLVAEKQTSIANKQKTLAEARKTEAENESEKSRRFLYLSQMNLAGQAWDQADISQMEDLLTAQIPKPGQEDLRGFEWFYLWSLSHRDLWSSRERLSPGFSPDGNIVANNFGEPTQSRVREPKIEILDQATGRVINTFEDRVSLAISSEGKLMTIPAKEIDLRKDPENSADTYPVELLDVKTGQTSATKLKVASQSPFNFQFSPDGKLMAQRGRTGMEIWDVDTGNKIFSFGGDEGGNEFFDLPSFSADGKTFAIRSTKRSLGEGNHITVWDVATKKEVCELKTDRGSYFTNAALSPNGKRLATLGFNELKLWDVATQKEIRTIKEEQPERLYGSGVREIKFSPDGNILAETTGRAVKLWMPVGDMVIKGHGEMVGSVVFSPDSKKLATISGDGILKLWSLSGRETEVFNGRDPAFSADGKTLALASQGQVTLWDFANHKELGSFGEEKTDAKTGLSSPKISVDGKIVAVIRRFYSQGRSDSPEEPKSQLELWDPASRNKLATLEEYVRKFAFSPDGKLLVTIVSNRSNVISDWDVHLWDVATRKQISSLGRGSNVAFSPDGKVLAMGTDGKVKLIDLSTGLEIGSFFKLEGLSDESIKFSPGGKMLATIVGHNIILWDVIAQKEIATLKGHAGEIGSITFSPDGKRLVSSSWQDQTVRIWDMATHQKLSTFNIYAFMTAFSADGKTLLVETDHDIQIWRGATKHEVFVQNDARGNQN